MRTHTQLLITEFGAGYRLGTFALGPVVYPSLAVDVLAGGRYVLLERGGGLYRGAVRP